MSPVDVLVSSAKRKQRKIFLLIFLCTMFSNMERAWSKKHHNNLLQAVPNDQALFDVDGNEYATLYPQQQVGEVYTSAQIPSSSPFGRQLLYPVPYYASADTSAYNNLPSTYTEAEEPVAPSYQAESNSETDEFKHRGRHNRAANVGMYYVDMNDMGTNENSDTFGMDNMQDIYTVPVVESQDYSGVMNLDEDAYEPRDRRSVKTARFNEGFYDNTGASYSYYPYSEFEGGSRKRRHHNHKHHDESLYGEEVVSTPMGYDPYGTSNVGMQFLEQNQQQPEQLPYMVTNNEKGSTRGNGKKSEKKDASELEEEIVLSDMTRDTSSSKKDRMAPVANQEEESNLSQNKSEENMDNPNQPVPAISRKDIKKMRKMAKMQKPSHGHGQMTTYHPRGRTSTTTTNTDSSDSSINGIDGMFGVNELNRRRRSINPHPQYHAGSYPIIRPMAIPPPIRYSYHPQPLVYPYEYSPYVYNRGGRLGMPIPVMYVNPTEAPRRLVRRVIRRLPEPLLRKQKRLMMRPINVEKQLNYPKKPVELIPVTQASSKNEITTSTVNYPVSDVTTTIPPPTTSQSLDATDAPAAERNDVGSKTEIDSSTTTKSSKATSKDAKKSKKEVGIKN